MVFSIIARDCGWFAASSRLAFGNIIMKVNKVLAADKKRVNIKNYNRLVKDLGKLIEQYKKAVEKNKNKNKKYPWRPK